MSAFKEFFIGGPEVQGARSTVHDFGSKNSLTKRQERRFSAAKRITRRHAIRQILKGLGVAAFVGTGAYVLLGDDKGVDGETVFDSSSILSEIPVSDVFFVPQSPKFKEVAEHKPFELEYVKSLINELKVRPPIEDKEIQLDNIIKNVAIIKTDGIATAIRICESGYYLTAAHILSDRNGRPMPADTEAIIFDISDPTEDGNLHEIKNYIIDVDTDLALFYAPSGKTRNAVPISISLSPLAAGKKLWLLGTTISETIEALYLNIYALYGRVDKHQPYETDENLVAVKGMIPFGGSSGGPVIDSEGSLVGIESGVLVKPGKQNERENYTHATISPLSNLDRLLVKQVHKHTNPR